MKMLRHYFISSDLDDLERLEEELELSGNRQPADSLLESG